MKTNERLRVLDINTPWFWFTIFYEPHAYEESWLKIELWNPHKWRKWWIYFWRVEDIPTGFGMESETLTRREENA